MFATLVITNAAASLTSFSALDNLPWASARAALALSASCLAVANTALALLSSSALLGEPLFKLFRLASASLRDFSAAVSLLVASARAFSAAGNCFLYCLAVSKLLWAVATAVCASLRAFSAACFLALYSFAAVGSFLISVALNLVGSATILFVSCPGSLFSPAVWKLWTKISKLE